jgi:phytoene/squalene synthetase
MLVESGRQPVKDDIGRDFLVNHLQAIDRDGYLALLFAPSPLRPRIAAIYGLLIELMRIPLSVREAGAARLRLAWWADSVAAVMQDKSQTAHHPVLQALAEIPSQADSGASAFAPLFQAIDFALDGQPPRDMAAMIDFVDASWGEAARLACRLCEATEDEAARAGVAAQAVGLTHLVLETPRWSAIGRLFLPADRLAHCGVSLDMVESSMGETGIGKTEPASYARVVQEVADEARKLLAEADRANQPHQAASRPFRLLAGLARRDLRRLARVQHDPWRLTADRWPIIRSLGTAWRGWRG